MLILLLNYVLFVSLFGYFQALSNDYRWFIGNKCSHILKVLSWHVSVALKLYLADTLLCSQTPNSKQTKGCTYDPQIPVFPQNRQIVKCTSRILTSNTQKHITEATSWGNRLSSKASLYRDIKAQAAATAWDVCVRLHWNLNGNNAPPKINPLRLSWFHTLWVFFCWHSTVPNGATLLFSFSFFSNLLRLDSFDYRRITGKPDSEARWYNEPPSMSSPSNRAISFCETRRL